MLSTLARSIRSRLGAVSLLGAGSGLPGLVAQAADHASVCLMAADAAGTIVYINPALRRLFDACADDLRKRYPWFDPARIVGESLDRFHADPAHQRRLLAAMGEEHVARIQVGPRRFRLTLRRARDAGGPVGYLVEWFDLGSAIVAEQHALRLRSALDGMPCKLMIADAEDRVLYANEAVLDMFRRHRATFEAAFPGFDPEALVGRPIAAFHRDPAHQAGLLRALRGSWSGAVSVGGIRLELHASAIRDGDGSYLGAYVVWDDISAVHALVRDVSRGVPGLRLDPGDYRGSMRTLAELLNAMVEAVERPVLEAAEVAVAMARGDLSRRMATACEGIHAELAAGLNRSTEALGGIVGGIDASAHALTAAAGGIAEASIELSNRNERQAALVEEVGAAVGQLDQTAGANAQQLDALVQRSRVIREAAVEGGAVARGAAGLMAETSRESRRIQQIVEDMAGIAHQTNLLALNAAVEAARAGEQGRGFAVVAAEVRALAQRSAQSAAQIKQLAEALSARIADGAERTGQAAERVDRIAQEIEAVDVAIGALASAGREQSLQVGEILGSVREIDGLTQQNAALSEESAAAAVDLDRLARSLGEQVAVFTVASAKDGE